MSHSRRHFLRTLSFAIPALSLSRLSFAEDHQPLGAQLYTVRDLVQQDLPRVLQQIRKIGYQEVETYDGMYGRPAAQLRQLILEHGLRVPSGHFGYDTFDKDLDYARELGVEYIICPMLPHAMWNSLDDFERAADQFNQWGAKAQTLGIQFAFHNHNYEFQQFHTHNGHTRTGLQAILDGTDPKLVHWEMDCYWVTQSGHDPIAMLRKYRNRIRLLHLKDRRRGFPPSTQMDAAAEHFTEVGTGTVDFKDILAIARRQGIHHLYVEQDSTTIPPMESLQISYRNLRQILSELH